jgi:hypothetical protein
MNLLNINDIETAILSGNLACGDVAAAKSQLDNEIEACDDVLRDPEVEEHMKQEYRVKKRKFLGLKNRI